MLFSWRWVSGRFQPERCACLVWGAAMLAALCSPRRSFQQGCRACLGVFVAFYAAMVAALLIRCDSWRPCPSLRGSATLCLRRLWRPCPSSRGLATLCLRCWGIWLRRCEGARVGAAGLGWVREHSALGGVRVGSAGVGACRIRSKERERCRV